MAIKGIQKKRYAQFNKISSSSVNSLKYLENSICSYPHDNIQNALRILNTFEPSLWFTNDAWGNFRLQHKIPNLYLIIEKLVGERFVVRQVSKEIASGKTRKKIYYSDMLVDADTKA